MYSGSSNLDSVYHLFFKCPCVHRLLATLLEDSDTFLTRHCEAANCVAINGMISWVHAGGNCGGQQQCERRCSLVRLFVPSPVRVASTLEGYRGVHGSHCCKTVRTHVPKLAILAGLVQVWFTTPENNETQNFLSCRPVVLMDDLAYVWVRSIDSRRVLSENGGCIKTTLLCHHMNFHGFASLRTGMSGQKSRFSPGFALA